MMAPFFSVIVPTRNRPKEFSKALHSILEQTFEDYEVVVVNDGTSREHQPEYNRVELASGEKVSFLHLLERKNGHGHCYGRNHGVSHARGEYICFLDDDDLWTDKEYLGRAYEYIKKEGADLYLANQQARSKDGTRVEGLWLNDLSNALNIDKASSPVFKVSIDQLMKVSGFAHMNCWAISKKLYWKIGGMDENLRYEPDRDIYMRAIDAARVIMHDTHEIAMHNIPDKTKRTNASTAGSQIQRLLFQLRTADKGVLFLQNATLRKKSKIQKGYILKKLAVKLNKNERKKEAFFYAREALAVLPSLKWVAFTIMLWLRSHEARKNE